MRGLRAAGGAAAIGAVVGAAAGCGGGGSPTTTTASPLLIVVNAPVSTDPYVAGVIRRGADLAVRELNAKGVTVAGATYTLRLRVDDDGGDAQRAAANTRKAIGDGAVGVIEDGVGAATTAGDSATAGMPEIVVSDGTADLLKDRPSLFRLAIPNDAAASVMGTYLSKKTLDVAIVHDDGDAGRDGADQLTQALATAGARVVANREVAAAEPALDAPLHAVADAHPGAVAVWGSDTFIARVVKAAHDDGISVPLYGGPQGESPAVRQVAGAAAEGLSFPAARMTAEDDTTSFAQFEHRLATAEGGPVDAGVKDSRGREIRQPADQEVFSYDAVRLLAAALSKSGSTHPGSALLTALAQVTVKSAQGDNRAFNPDGHEGLADDDVYIAHVADAQFVPVKDDPLAASLPPVDQVLADFH